MGAAQGFRKALEWQRLLREPLPLSYTVRDIALLMAHHGSPTLAATLYGCMAGLRIRLGYPPALHEFNMLKDIENSIRALLTPEAYQRALDTGKALDFEQSLALALEALDQML